MHDIVTLVDLEADVLRVLASFNIPSIQDLRLTLTKDENELDISEVDEGVPPTSPLVASQSPSSSSKQIKSFRDYGIGEFRVHPSICHLFPVHPSTPLTLSEVYAHVAVYAANISSVDNLDLSAFANYLATQKAKGIDNIWMYLHNI